MAGSAILLGVIGRPHGVRGLVHVVSYTADPAALFAYGPLADAKGRRFLLRPAGQGLAELAELGEDGPVAVRDRDAAARLVNTRLFIDRGALPAPEPEDFYLADLVGLAAFSPDGATLGAVAAVSDHGAGPYLEVRAESGGARLVPFTRRAVPEIDLAAGRIVIDPPGEIDAAMAP